MGKTHRVAGFWAGMLKVAPNYRSMLTLLYKLEENLITSADFCIISMSQFFVVNFEHPNTFLAHQCSYQNNKVVNSKEEMFWSKKELFLENHYFIYPSIMCARLSYTPQFWTAFWKRSIECRQKTEEVITPNYRKRNSCFGCTWQRMTWSSLHKCHSMHQRSMKQ